MLYRYLFLIIGCASLLIGMQVPNFLTQYQQRLDAQLTEVSINLSGFQEIADRYFDGDLNALVLHHEQSDDVIFRDEAEPLRNMLTRFERFSAEQLKLQTSYPKQLWHLLTGGQPDLKRATWENYNTAVPLSERALLTGVVFTVTLLVILDLLVGLLFRRARSGSGRRRPDYH